MAKGAKTTERVEVAEREERVVMVESKYTVAEFVKNAHVFNTCPEVVAVALREKKITQATEEEARKIVKAFLERKV